MLISIDENDSRPIYLQITNQVKEQVIKGMLPPGTELPSVRELAESLAINMHTVRSAYLKLRDDGIIRLRLGRRAVVTRRQVRENINGLQNSVESRLKEVITDALAKGLSPSEIRQLIDRQLEQMK